MALADITRSEILQAVAEFDRLGRDPFLHRYGFARARNYLLAIDGKEYDSKAIVGAAHGCIPGQEPLPSDGFSGGQGHAVKVLENFGFQVVYLPAVTEATIDELVERIEKLRVGNTLSGPLLYQPITLLWAIGRATRAEARVRPWAETREALAGLLTRHNPRGERPRPDYPLAALYHSGLWTLEGYSGVVPPAHGDAGLRRWFAEQQPSGGLAPPIHAIVRRSGEARIAMIEALVDRFFVGLDETAILTDVGLYDDTVADDFDDSPAPPADPVTIAAQYQKMCTYVEQREPSHHGRRRQHMVNDPIRSAEARKAVLARSLRRCENPGCLGQPTDVTDNDDPILEVDHLEEIALGGRDHPSQMIALCPNCHAVKTRGRTRNELRATLLVVALARHRKLMNAADK
ncbi:HNH endonuclease signature motif containing protein [Streptomyces niveus]|uniref:HNH endonuclease n=1 Tax=Streptomyces niveus TaxID=193462 RepID=UPI00386F134E|nr:HNH endonuclease signature motif containing protein [Streptomyces niveus]